MADSTTEIDLDSVIDRLLEGELACCTFVIVIARNAIWDDWVHRALAERRGSVWGALLFGERSITPYDMLTPQCPGYVHEAPCVSEMPLWNIHWHTGVV
jgi:hypothetical protein